ncbi:MAG: PQQ-binding-like beta-propeller repeat protein, partial [Candidatus Saccharimonas sp.]|nr:PQQ-binding-like beta-propeller repeat protein [Planctomycetaceae bacterium]
ASDPTAGTPVWRNDRDKTVLSSPALTGDRVIFATATDIGPFSPEGRGAIVCVDAHSGKEIWRYAPDNYRATFSSPVVHENCVVCGEGLHQVDDARVTCLDLSSGAKKWEFRTKSHVESTAAIADGHVFLGAGDDGFYCLSLEPTADGQPQVVWHLNGEEFRDCESSPVVSEGVVYFGLGDGGFAVCAVEAKTGTLLWRVKTPYPVFAPPTLAKGKLYIATGNGNFVQSAADLWEMKLQMLKDDGASEQQLAAARERLKPVGEVWCIDLATHSVDWKFETGDAILGAVVCADDSLYFGSRDGHLYRVSPEGKLLQKVDLREPLISSPALGRKHVYCTTTSGRLFCLESGTLKLVWDASLGGGETFASSPAIAHGHVYIGTAQQGLCCLGQPGTPEPPLWTHGERGGSADDDRVPESLAVAWQFPTEGDAPIVVTAPLMPLDGAVYAAGTRTGRQEFIKLDAAPSALAAEHERRQVWSRQFAGPVTVPPVGCGHRLCVVEGISSTANQPRLHCLSADDGQTFWSDSLTGLPSGMTIDSRRIFVWGSATRLRCLDLESGSVLWDTDEAAVSSGGRTEHTSTLAPPPRVPGTNTPQKKRT